jgi:hypothetical protein
MHPNQLMLAFEKLFDLNIEAFSMHDQVNYLHISGEYKSVTKRSHHVKIIMIKEPIRIHMMNATMARISSSVHMSWQFNSRTI